MLKYIHNLDVYNVKIHIIEMIGNIKSSFILGLDDEEDFSGPPALETIEVQQQQVSNNLINKKN